VGILGTVLGILENLQVSISLVLDSDPDRPEPYQCESLRIRDTGSKQFAQRMHKKLISMQSQRVNDAKH
jgi:hypothetical protein